MDRHPLLDANTATDAEKFRYECDFVRRFDFNAQLAYISLAHNVSDSVSC